MSRRKRPLPSYDKVQITAAAAKGKCVARIEDKVIFVPFAAPGDVVDIQVVKKKRAYLEGRIIKFHKYSDQRTEPQCLHFGLCGGCNWQHITYANQLANKQQEVEDSMQRIAKVPVGEYLPIIGADSQYYYRNKLEYTFSDRKWLTNLDASKGEGVPQNTDGLGFHIPGKFDKILDIENCYLQKDPSNSIRLAIKEYAIEHNLDFYNVRNHEGFLRNLIIRTSSTGDLMVIVVFRYDDLDIADMLKVIADEFPEITSLMYVVNEKFNDTIWDLDIKLFKGNPYLLEEMKSPDNSNPNIKFKIGPVSFYQTNPDQAYSLYKAAFNLADFKGDELVYDLYTGAGTIATFIAKHVNRVVGIESVEEAVEGARKNAELNNIQNIEFFAGDMLKILTEEFISAHGKPDVVITDPPRAGMHEKVVKQILNTEPGKILYISCNPATQARDIALFAEKYDVIKSQPVDMFPQTHHVENVVLLLKR